MQFRNITLSFPQIDQTTQILVARFKLSRRKLRYLTNRLEELQEILIADHLVATAQLDGRDLIVEYEATCQIPQSRMKNIFKGACQETGLFQNRPSRHRRYSRHQRR